MTEVTKDTTSTKIQPIETKYNGYRFRSRLEARWAVFFDALNIKWEYEPEGYDLGAFGYYLPDFYLTHEGISVEVKPEGHVINNDKYIEFCKRVGKQIAVFVGVPDTKYYTCFGVWESDITAIDAITYDTRRERIWYAFGCDDDADQMLGDVGVAAIIKSRSKRFEFGE